MRIMEIQQNRESGFTLIRIHVLNKLRSWLISLPPIVISTAVLGTAALIFSLWDKSGRRQHAVARAWGRFVLKVSFVPCRAYGTEKLDPAGSYVFVCNHASYFDTFALLSELPLQYRFFAKRGLFSIPFLGWFLARAGHLPVDLGDVRKSLKSMTQGARMIQERGTSMLLFPEGGRTLTQMRPFKEGAVYIAIKAGVPIVPIGLSNTRKVLRMHTSVIHPQLIELRVGDPIPTAELTIRDRGRLNTMLEEQVAKLAGEPPIDHNQKDLDD